MDLKPCPFCGDKAHDILDVKTRINLSEWTPISNETTHIYWINCRVCQFSSWQYPTECSAIKAWNKRI